MSRGQQEIQGLAARRAALRLLDAALRRGETLDQAAGAATAGLLTSSDIALARAIAGEVLRWLVDLDALIDSATRQRLADDAKALGSINAQLKRGGEGRVNFVVIRDEGAREDEIELPGAYRLTAEVAGGIKALEGVMDVRFN